MDETEKEFLNDLFEATLKYATNRPDRNAPQAKLKLYGPALGVVDGFGCASGPSRWPG